MNKHLIVCPVDYSANTEPAISLAADLAQVNKSKVVLLHVIEQGGEPVSMAESHNQQFQVHQRDHFLNLSDVEFQHLTRHGNPAEITVDYAKQNAADMIVMGTHGRSGLASLVVGSVAKKVMAHASCPVVIVKLPALSSVNS